MTNVLLRSKLLLHVRILLEDVNGKNKIYYLFFYQLECVTLAYLLIMCGWRLLHK